MSERTVTQINTSGAKVHYLGLNTYRTAYGDPTPVGPWVYVSVQRGVDYCRHFTPTVASLARVQRAQRVMSERGRR